MVRIPPRQEVNAPPIVTEIFAQVRDEIGRIPNFIAAMANAPVVAQSYLVFARLLGAGSLKSRFREQIALTVAETTGSAYCLAVHTALGRAVGLTNRQINASRHAEAANKNEQIALEFVREIVRLHGQVEDADILRLRSAGYTNAEITELIAHVALNLLTGYFNNVAGTELDFPKAPDLDNNIPRHDRGIST